MTNKEIDLHLYVVGPKIAYDLDRTINMGMTSKKRSADQVLVVMVTAANQKEAIRIGKVLVKAKLAACVNVVPSIQSIYRWNGKVVKAQEVLLILKSTKPRYSALEREIKAIHTYDTPEIIALPVKEGLSQYIGWVYGETNG